MDAKIWVGIGLYLAVGLLVSVVSVWVDFLEDDDDIKVAFLLWPMFLVVVLHAAISAIDDFLSEVIGRLVRKIAGRE